MELIGTEAYLNFSGRYSLEIETMSFHIKCDVSLMRKYDYEFFISLIRWVELGVVVIILPI